MGFGFRAVVAISLTVFPGLVFAQVKSDEPIKTTLCDLVKEPERFNGKMVEIRATIATGPEAIVVSDDRCSGSIWLSVGERPTSSAREFAYINSIMDIRTPDRLDWTPFPPLQPVILRKDGAFRRFDKYLGQQCEGRGRKSAFSHCPAFNVSATLIGRFDHGDGKLIAIRPTASGTIGAGSLRYGHLGAWDSQLALQSVSDVIAKRIDPSLYEKK